MKRKLNPLTDEQRALAADPANIRRAFSVASRFAAIWANRRQEINSHAMFGLVVAASTYDPAHGVKFENWIYIKVTGAIKDGMRKEAESRKKRGIEEELLGEWQENVCVSEDHVGWEVDSADAVEGLARKLPSHHQQVIRLYFLYPLTMRQIGRRIGLTESRVCQIVKDGLRMLNEDVTCR